MSAPDLDQRLSGLVGHIYDAAIDERLWDGLASRISAVFDSPSAIVKVHGRGDSVDLLDATDNIASANADRAWAEHWHRNDLWVERAAAFGLSRIVTGDDLVSPAEARGSAFYQEWLRRLDIHHVIGSAFAVGNGGIGILGVHRPPGAAHYGAAERRKMALLLPHAERALRLRRRLAGISLLQRAALEALDQLEIGLVVLDRSRRIVHANAVAEDLFCENAEVSVANSRLALRSSALNAELGAALHEVLETAAGRLSKVVPVLAVPRDGGPPLMLALAPLRPGRGQGEDERPPIEPGQRRPGSAGCHA
ncbi:MAG: hypothetical protein ACREFZ_01440 [Acetobacteraceae bacterium]